MKKEKLAFQQKTPFAPLIVVFQVFAYLFAALPLRLFYRATRKLPEDIHMLTKGSLLVSNHQSLADPFIVTANLPARVFFRLLPIYFPVDHFWIRKPFFKILLPCLGCYDVGSTRREKMMALFFTHQLLEQKKTVFLFPEGEISNDQIKEFQKGIEYFVHAAIAVIFVRMEGFHLPNSSFFIAPKRKLFYSSVKILKGGEHDVSSLRQHIESMSAA